MSESYEYLDPVINQIVESHGLTFERSASSRCWLEFRTKNNLRCTIILDMLSDKVVFTMELSLGKLRKVYSKTNTAKN